MEIKYLEADVVKAFRRAMGGSIMRADGEACAAEPAIKWLRLWRNNTGGFGRMRYGLGLGSPDYVGIDTRTGQFVGVELKSPTGKLSESQEIWHAQAALFGAKLYVINSMDVKAIRGMFV